jgi:hypothetical protein
VERIRKPLNPRRKRKKRKRINIRKLNPEDRQRNAKKWLIRPKPMPKDLVAAYAKRYAVSDAVAHWELLELGYRDEIAIQAYEKDGVEWEYKVDGYTGEMYAVPKGTTDWELYDYY